MTSRLVSSVRAASRLTCLGIALASALTAPGADNPPQQKPKPPHSFGPEAALAETAGMTAAEGLEVKLVASEPMLVNPADIDVDEQGRIWVCEGANYRSTFQKWGILREGGDRIQVLLDKNRDGKAEKAATFYQDPTVNTALGICVLGNKVIV